jgi:putative membrane protein insertion efficiency factor
MNNVPVPTPTIPVRVVLWYQRLFEGRPSPCRFTPSCSAYALEALEAHGTGRGLALTVRRLLRCRPFGPSGWDPVPELPHAAASCTTEPCTAEKGC